MTRLNIEFLIDTSIENILSKLDTIFEKLLQEIRAYLNLDSIFLDIKIISNGDNKISDDLKEDFFKMGVKKIQKDNSLTIHVSKDYEKFIRIILLREAYSSFIPSELQESEVVNIFIDQKVEIDLQKSEYIEDWKEIKRKRVVSYDFMEAEFDRLDKFLKQESVGNKPSPFQFFFSFIRKNVQLIDDYKEKFYDLIFQEYVQKYTEYNDEIIETISIITKIFYKLRSYRSLLDYQRYFKDFKDSGIIQSNLSLRKFTENMQWIKNFSIIAPSFQINWLGLEILSIVCYLKFHPIINNSKILKIINQLPFFSVPRYTKNDFGIEIIGYFLIPKIYLKDIINFIENLNLNSYVIEKKIFTIKSARYTVNLNCFKDNAIKNIILRLDKRDYNKEYELEFDMEYGVGKLKSSLSLLDWLLIDRIRYVSITGLGFERKSETLNSLKSDLLNEIASQRNLISEIKQYLNRIQNSVNLKKKLLDFIDSNKLYGFFYIKQILNDYITALNLINRMLSENVSVKNYYDFQRLLKESYVSKSIEENILLKTLRDRIFRDFISIYFKSKKKFIEIVDEFNSFYKVIEKFYDLKVFNLEIIKSIVENKSLIYKIYQSKEEKLKNSYERNKLYAITNHFIEQRLEDFSSANPPIIIPSLINTIGGITHFRKYNSVLILKDNLETRKSIKKLKWLFPIAYIFSIREYKSHKNYVYFELQMPNLSLNEKQLLYSIFHDSFGENIVSIKSYAWSGFSEAFSRKDFYDFEKQNFFYNKDLFKQLFINVKIILNEKLYPISESFSEISKYLWGKEKEISKLIKHIDKRVSKEHIDFNINNLINFQSFYKDLKSKILDLEKFKDSKNEYFFRNYIKSIKFIPLFQNFGVGQYFLYFFPIDLREIDFKHLLHNSFQKIKFPTNIDKSNSFLIKFLWPYRNPNISLLNWLVKSKKVIRDYCLFFIKKGFQIFHFDYNLTVNGWDLDPNRFRIYIQNIIFDRDYKLQMPGSKEFNVGSLNISNYFTPESSEYKSLIEIYSWKSIDIKSYLGTRNYRMVNKITDLLEKKLIFPYISTKNLDIKQKMYIILPNVNEKYNEKLLKIFYFFNIGFFYEIEGEYYIYGFPEEIKFENGIMIKIYLPDCRLDEFLKLFNLIFEYFDVKHYIILNDLVNGKNLLKFIYGDLDFLNSYNPLKNLIWNKKDKRWMNHKLFTNKFEKIYPPLQNVKHDW